MDEHSNSDLEQTNPDETLTYMVGRWRLLETPSLNLVADIPDLIKMYMVDVGDGELYMHSDILCENPGKVSNMKRLEQVFLSVCLGLYEQGFENVLTFIDPYDDTQRRFCEFFGFEETGYMQVFTTPEGKELVREVLVYNFPMQDESVII